LSRGEQRMTVLGRSFRMVGVPESVRASQLEQWHYPEHDLPQVGFDIELEWLSESDQPPALEGTSVQGRMLTRELTWRTSGDEWEWREGPAGVRLCLAGSMARIRAWGGADRTAVLHEALYMAVCEALRASGLIPLHAAATVPPVRGDALALAGRSGSGKSTTLLRAVESGWRPICEDMCWLDPVTERVYGWDRGVRVHPGTVEQHVPRLADAAWSRGRDGKLLLPYDVLGDLMGRDAHPRQATLGIVAMITRDAGTETRFEAMPPAESVRVLWESVGVPLATASRDRASEWIGRMASAGRTYRLRVGTTRIPNPPPAG
jgi:hypothetical protein